jgi:hypothetical protein
MATERSIRAKKAGDYTRPSTAGKTKPPLARRVLAATLKASTGRASRLETVGLRGRERPAIAARDACHAAIGGCARPA